MLKHIVVLLLFVQFSFGQIKEGIELCFEYKRAVSAFTSDKEANQALDKILSVIGASKNFTLITCDNIFNALAVTYKGERYILYDGDFMKKISELTNDWSSTFILAHEVGHHINGHTRDFLLASVLDDNSLAKERQEELEADEFASFVLAKLGASYDEIKEGIELLTDNNDDTYSTHPSQDKRLAAIRTGYNRAIANNNTKTVEKVTNETPKLIVNSKWSYITRTRKQIYNDLSIDYSNLDPFERRKEDLYWPERDRIITVEGLSTDASKQITLKIGIYDYQNEYGLPNSVLNLRTQPELELRKKLKINKFFQFSIENYQETPRVVADRHISLDSPYLKNKEGETIITFPHSELRDNYYRLKVNYIIDDNSGFFLMEMPVYELFNSYHSEYPPKAKNPLKIEFYDTRDGDIEGVIAQHNFIDRLKKGRKLYIKIDGVYDFLGENRIESRLQEIFKKTTYVFDLKGSSAALSF